MDFRTLSRRELQALCKRNKIPANLTNVAMADALAALPSVEGIEEFLNGVFTGVPESPMKEEGISSEIPRTAARTTTRRKAVKDDAITTRTRRTAAARSTEETENRDLNVAMTTPSLPSGRRRTAVASSACKKVDFQVAVDVVEIDDEDLDQEKNVIEKTPAVPKSQKRVAGASTRKRTETQNNVGSEQRVYSTRRSVRLLEKTMESLCLGEDGKMEPMSVPMSFDEMPNSSEPVKEDTDLEIESKKTDESERKLDEALGLEIDDQEKNNMEPEVKISEVEPEMDLDSLNSSAENLVTAKSCDDSETEDDNLDVKCISEDEEANEASKVDDAVEISAEEVNDSDKISLPSENVDLTEVHNSIIVEESGMEVESKQNESICELEHIIEEEVKPMNISAEELSLPHENVEEETQVDDDVWSSDEDSVMEMKESEPTMEEEEEATLNVDIEEDKKEIKMEEVSVQAEEDDTTIKSNELPEKVSEELVDDVKIQFQMEEEAPKDIVNVNDTIDSQPEIPNEIQCEEALVEVSVTKTEAVVQSVPSFASQFPRPTAGTTKSQAKEQAIRLIVESSDTEEEEEKEEEKANGIQRQNVEINDFSLRQLKKKFREQLQIGKKKMDNNNNNTKVVGGEGKVRTALQQLPENRMAMDVERKV